MEKAQNLVAVRYSSKWTDLGDWDAVWLETEKDYKGNAVSEGGHAIDCSNSFLRSESEPRNCRFRFRGHCSNCHA